jgi:threonine dehydratase
MYERFTDRAKKVMRLANQEAQRFNHPRIGTEQILLGMLKEGSGVAANVLKNLDIDLTRVRGELEKIAPPGMPAVVMGRLPLTPNATRLLDEASLEAGKLGHNYVGTEHLLLGLARLDEGVAAQVLRNHGLRLEDVHQEVLDLLGHGSQGHDPPAPLFSVHSPLIRLASLFPDRDVYAKCEFLAPSGCFKIRGAVHLLEHLARTRGPRQLVVPSMGNTALGAAVGAKAFGFGMIGVVPQTIARDKDEKLQALGVELIKIAGGGSALLSRATAIAQERGGYFVHPHLDPQWTDGYQAIAAEILDDLPACRSIVFPLGGGGLLMGITEHLRKCRAAVKLFGCEPYNYPKYARFEHARSATIADGLLLETPHPKVQERIAEDEIAVPLVPEADIRGALRDLYESQGLVVEPSSAITTAFVNQHAAGLEEPICVILTGANITREDHARHMAAI